MQQIAMTMKKKTASDMANVITTYCYASKYFK